MLFYQLKSFSFKGFKDLLVHRPFPKITFYFLFLDNFLQFTVKVIQSFLYVFLRYLFIFFICVDASYSSSSLRCYYSFESFVFGFKIVNNFLLKYVATFIIFNFIIFEEALLGKEFGFILSYFFPQNLNLLLVNKVNILVII